MWGFIGWLVDRWLETGGIATGIGVVLGVAGGIYLSSALGVGRLTEEGAR